MTTVTVGTDITIKATDEMGTKFTKVIHVYVGNESAIVAKAEDMTVVTGTQLDAVPFLEVLWRQRFLQLFCNFSAGRFEDGCGNRNT